MNEMSKQGGGNFDSVMVWHPRDIFWSPPTSRSYWIMSPHTIFGLYCSFY